MLAKKWKPSACCGGQWVAPATLYRRLKSAWPLCAPIPPYGLLPVVDGERARMLRGEVTLTAYHLLGSQNLGRAERGVSLARRIRSGFVSHVGSFCRQDPNPDIELATMPIRVCSCVDARIADCARPVRTREEAGARASFI